MNTQQQSVTWHAESIRAVLEILEVESTRGLGTKQVEERQERYGQNVLSYHRSSNWWRLLARQFQSPLIFILLVAAALTAWLEEGVDTVVILVVVALNAAIGIYQEYRSGKLLDALRRVVRVSALVVRDGTPQQVDAAELVPGDIILLKAGAKVPADARLIEVRDVAVNEAVLTGESAAVKKQTDPLPQTAALGDRSSMVWMGTVIERGSGRAIVTATGIGTEFGRIAALTSAREHTLTPLQQRLRHLAQQIGAIVVVAAGILVAVGLVSDIGFVTAFKTAVAVAVAAIPEGLVAALSVVLAVSTNKILRLRGLVRTPVAAETLGSTTVICADKTGTLTEGVMRVHEALFEGDPQRARLALALANEALLEVHNREQRFRGESTDQAKLAFALNEDPGLAAVREHYLERAFLPFDSATKYLAAFVEDGTSGSATCFVSGAPEILLERSIELGSGDSLTDTRRTELVSQQERLAAEGYRLVAVAERSVPRTMNFSDTDGLHRFVNNLRFLGVVALRDELRPAVLETLTATREAGIRVVMVTGDHRLTATAIGRELGFRTSEGNVVEGTYLDTLSDEALVRAVNDIDIYCRVTPEHKLRIVKAFLDRGESVAMTGDGINDAPALRAADIGVATESATDVTKEAADLVLLDNGLTTIVAAVRQGRIAFDNIKKVALFLFSASFTELILILATMLIGAPLPLTPVMILWANIIQDGLPTFSLAFERGESDVMRRPPVSRRAPILDRQGRVIVFGTSLFRDFLLLGLFLWFSGPLAAPLAYVRTLMFAVIAINPLLYIFAMKSFSEPLWRSYPLGNRFLLSASALGLVVAGAAIYAPFFNRFLGTVPLALEHLAIVPAVALLDIVMIEVVKRWSRNLAETTASMRSVASR